MASSEDSPATPIPRPQIPRTAELDDADRANTDNSQAKAEERQLSANLTADQIAQRAAANEHDRDQRFRDCFEVIAISALHLTYLALGTVALVWALHLVLPPKLRWLSAEDLTHIQTILTAGVLVGIAGNHVKKRLGGD